VHYSELQIEMTDGFGVILESNQSFLLLIISPVLKCIMLCKKLHSNSCQLEVTETSHWPLVLVTKMQCLSLLFSSMAFILKMFHKSACGRFWPTLSKVSIVLCLTVDKLLRAELLPTP